MNKSNIYFHYNKVKENIKEPRKIKKLIEYIFEKEEKKFSYTSIVFCTDIYLKEINIKFLKHQTYTDVITFQYNEINKPIEGEIFISSERIRENAKEFKETIFNERLRIIIHGILHLCSYQDKTAKSKENMTKREDFYLQKYNKL